MPRAKKTKTTAKRSTNKGKKIIGINLAENFTSLILGAVIVVILGLLVANFITKRNQQIGNGEQSTNQSQQSSDMTKNYKVMQGDSLSAISEKYYGSQEMWPVLASVNNIANPNVILADDSLKIPPKVQAEKIQTEMSQTSYNVNEGDTLFTIAQKMYGDGSKWTILDQANNVGRLPNGNPLIFAGSTIVIPR